MSMRPATKSGSEPIPGYTLRKRLGAGGYGEVWLADAPGGLQKAVKLIYGTLDQSHATSELRSLQRIRQVYHPFLLSIERIEIIDSQVIIVTELAESSLLDRFEQCRRKGAPGIERALLLDFMRDAADALDFLSQKHALQHLDIKPGNLLVIADRIKVGDFGLIKDLHDQNQSLVSGLTPTYSAPEIFDGRPDYRSDQYSLAIVYMEMLAGQLPFNGKSTGELARQHLTQQPDLDSLPPADRPVVARALSKNPLDRFGTCRLFIEQLLKTR
ncbi:MAG: serine/threonine protein kinase, partial [Planctomycetales bacterium]|nr:serine/threonine protein kinase [Planctomycetales bacterium]